MRSLACQDCFIPGAAQCFSAAGPMLQYALPVVLLVPRHMSRSGLGSQGQLGMW